MTERKMTDGMRKARAEKVNLSLCNIRLNNGKNIKDLNLKLGGAYITAIHNANLFTTDKNGTIAWNPKAHITPELVPQIVDAAYAKGQTYQQTYLAKQESLVNTKSEAVVLQLETGVLTLPKTEERAVDEDILTKLVHMHADMLVRLVRLEHKIDILNSNYGM